LQPERTSIITEYDGDHMAMTRYTSNSDKKKKEEAKGTFP